MIGLLKKAISFIFGKRLVAYICGAEALPKPLTPEEEEQYAVAAKNGDAAAREKLIEHNLRLVVYIAKKFENTSVDTEDLVSKGPRRCLRYMQPTNRPKDSAPRRFSPRDKRKKAAARAK